MPMTIGQKIKVAQKKVFLSQADMAKELGVAFLRTIGERTMFMSLIISIKGVQRRGVERFECAENCFVFIGCRHCDFAMSGKKSRAWG